MTRDKISENLFNVMLLGNPLDAVVLMSSCTIVRDMGYLVLFVFNDGSQIQSTINLPGIKHWFVTGGRMDVAASATESELFSC